MRIINKISLSLIVACIYLNIPSTDILAQTAAKKSIALTKPTPKEIEEGKALLSKSDCLACHKVDTKLVGPNYKEVANKYVATEANYNLLAQKIIKGGSGVWGAIPMSAHSSLKPEDAKKMVKYILSLK